MTVTCAEFTNTLLFSALILTVPPDKVGKLSLASPVVRRLEYPTVPLITWYSRMLDSCWVVRVEVWALTALKAASEGAKIVTSLRESTAVRRLVALSPLARDVRLLETAAVEGGGGTVKTVSMIWITPPLNIIF